MQLKTFRASTMHEALALVRRELGPDAAVLHTREVRRRGFWKRFSGGREIEVTASTDVVVPSRLPQRAGSETPRGTRPVEPAARHAAARHEPHDEIRQQVSELQTMVANLCRRSAMDADRGLPEGLFEVYTNLIDADLDEQQARELADQARPIDPRESPADIKQRLARQLEDELTVGGPIVCTSGKQRRVALVGPTGVGKTTTIAKLAANFRLRERRNVGLITVDTYRIAAVEQLRTYADIIDLPMQVVSTPHEMREAVRQLSDMDLVLMDTAGRSPRDQVKIQELRAFLTEAEADEVHLVLSAVGSAANLIRTAEQFAQAGTSGVVLTKLDEATGLGNVLHLLRQSKLPVRYLTDGQNVPDDIEAADSRRLARMILGMERGS